MTRRPALLVTVGLGLLVTVVLTVIVVVRWAPLAGLDSTLVGAAHGAGVAEGSLRSSGRVVSAIGSPVAVDLVSALGGLALLAARRWRPSVALMAARLGELGCEILLKVLVGRPRPVSRPPLTTATGFSFPSGHSAGSAAVYGVVALLALIMLPRPAGLTVAVSALLLVLAVGVSRVVLGVHYPSDVVAGFGIGTVWAAGSVAFVMSRRAGPPDATAPQQRGVGCDT